MRPHLPSVLFGGFLNLGLTDIFLGFPGTAVIELILAVGCYLYIACRSLSPMSGE
jgi:hypothetical protein